MKCHACSEEITDKSYRYCWIKTIEGKETTYYFHVPYCWDTHKATFLHVIVQQKYGELKLGIDLRR